MQLSNSSWDQETCKKTHVPLVANGKEGRKLEAESVPHSCVLVRGKRRPSYVHPPPTFLLTASDFFMNGGSYIYCCSPKLLALADKIWMLQLISFTDRASMMWFDVVAQLGRLLLGLGWRSRPWITLCHFTDVVIYNIYNFCFMIYYLHQ